MRKLNRIVIHCTATMPFVSVDSIKRFWKEVCNWKAPGYHFLIKPNGVSVELLPIDKVSNGARGYNHDSIHIAYIGGINHKKEPEDTRTDKQKETLLTLISNIMAEYPDLKIIGHRDLPGVKKACPSFNVKQWLADVFNN